MGTQSCGNRVYLIIVLCSIYFSGSQGTHHHHTHNFLHRKLIHLTQQSNNAVKLTLLDLLKFAIPGFRKNIGSSQVSNFVITKPTKFPVKVTIKPFSVLRNATVLETVTSEANSIKAIQDQTVESDTTETIQVQEELITFGATLNNQSEGESFKAVEITEQPISTESDLSITASDFTKNVTQDTDLRNPKEETEVLKTRGRDIQTSTVNTLIVTTTEDVEEPNISYTTDSPTTVPTTTTESVPTTNSENIRQREIRPEPFKPLIFSSGPLYIATENNLDLPTAESSVTVLEGSKNLATTTLVTPTFDISTTISSENQNTTKQITDENSESIDSENRSRNVSTVETLGQSTENSHATNTTATQTQIVFTFSPSEEESITATLEDKPVTARSSTDSQLHGEFQQEFSTVKPLSASSENSTDKILTQTQENTATSLEAIFATTNLVTDSPLYRESSLQISTVEPTGQLTENSYSTDEISTQTQTIFTFSPSQKESITTPLENTSTTTNPSTVSPVQQDTQLHISTAGPSSQYTDKPQSTDEILAQTRITSIFSPSQEEKITRPLEDTSQATNSSTDSPLHGENVTETESAQLELPSFRDLTENEPQDEEHNSHKDLNSADNSDETLATISPDLPVNIAKPSPSTTELIRTFITTPLDEGTVDRLTTPNIENEATSQATVASTLSFVSSDISYIVQSSPPSLTSGENNNSNLQQSETQYRPSESTQIAYTADSAENEVATEDPMEAIFNNMNVNENILIDPVPVKKSSIVLPAFGRSQQEQSSH